MKIKKRLEIFKGQKYYQHPKRPEIISMMEPLIYFNEINPEFFIENIQVKEILNCLIKQIYG